MANTVKDFAAPDGPILLLSAKGSTTASIAEADGVKDFSGNRNHGQAYGGITVLDGGEGFALDDTTTARVEIQNFSSAIVGATGMTISMRIKVNPLSTHSSVGGLCQNNYVAGFFYAVPNNFSFVDRLSSTSESIKSLSLEDYDTGVDFTEEHTITVTVAYTDGICLIYVDGQEKARSEDWLTGTKGLGNKFKLGSPSSNASMRSAFYGTIKDVRMYARTLSPSEVKYLHGGFQPNLIMGQTIPSGAILDLSARGLTTAGIAQANRVVDRSGKGNHGQAYNGVAIVNDDEMGSCFSFDLTNNVRIECPANNVGNNTDSFTISLAYKRTGKYSQASANQLLFSAANASNVAKFSIYCNVRTADNDIALALYTNTSTQTDFDISSIGKYTTDWHVYAMTYSYTNEMLYLYVDGSQVLSYSIAPEDSFELNKFLIGYPSQNVYHPVGLMTDIRAYPRALTASEVQQLADASLKKIRGINIGNDIIKHIYYGGNLVYTKIDEYRLHPKGVPYIISNITFGSSCRCAILLSSGEYVVTDWSNHCIRILNPDGTLKLTFGESGNGNGGFYNPYGICQDKDGYLYVSDYRGSQSAAYYLQKFSYNGTSVSFIGQLQVPGGGHQITYNKTRNKIIVNAYGSSMVLQVPTDLSTYTIIDTTSYCVGNAMSKDGTVLYCSSYSSGIYKSVYASAESTSATTKTNLISPGTGTQNIALSDDESFLIYMDSANSKIKKLDLSNNTVTELFSGLSVIGVSNAGNNTFLFMAGPSDTTMLYGMEL